MANHIAALLGIRARPEYAELVDLEELCYLLGVSERDALKLTQGEDFPEPAMRLHRHQANEVLPQPRRVWDRAEVERWAEKRGLALSSGETIEP